MLQTFTVEESTLDLLKCLQQIPMLKNLRLVGGTALALQLGHRCSVDLDFFGAITLSAAQISNELQQNNLIVNSIIQDTKNIKIFMVNDVKVDMVNYSYGWLDDAIKEEGITMAGIKDIAAMKLAAITNRGVRKDFIDVYFLLRHFSMNEMLDFYMQKYPDASTFNVVRSLSYFADAEQDPMPGMFEKVSWPDIKAKIRETVAQF